MPESTKDTRSTISTHVLDAARGLPAVGVHVTLYKLGEDDRPIRLTQALTDADGRVRDLLDRPLSAGVYRLEFGLVGRGGPESVKDGGAAVAASPSSPPLGASAAFFERMAVDVRVDDTARSYHVPLLLAPFSLTTYRGS